MGIQIGMRRIATIDFKEGELKTIPLELKNPLNAIVLELVGDWQATGAPGAGALRSDAAYRWLRQHRLLANNRPIQTMDGRASRPYHLLFDDELWPQVAPSSIADATDEAIRLTHIVPGYMGHSLIGEAFGIVPRGGVDYSLELQMGDADDLVDAVENAVAIANGVVNVYEMPYQGDRGPFAPLIIQRFEKEVNAAGEVVIDLNTLGPGTEVRALFIEGLSGGSNGHDYDHDDDVIVDLVSLEVDGEERMKTIPRETIQGRNVKFYGLAAIEAGVMVLDSAENRRTEPGQLWSVRSLRPKLTLNVAPQGGDNKIVVHAIATAGRGRS